MTDHPADPGGVSDGSAYPHEALQELIEQARPPKRLPWVIAVGAVLTTLVLSAILWALFQQNEDIRTAQACRSELAAADSAALGQVVLIIAQSASVTPTGRVEALARLGRATRTLEETQERRSHTTEICG
jgi:hypothetical protein